MKFSAAIIFSLAAIALIAGCVGQAPVGPASTMPLPNATVPEMIVQPEANATAPAATPVQLTYSPSILHIKSAHFENSAPGYGDVYATVPTKVVLNFNFNLGPPSDIKILYNGLDAGTGDTKIATNYLAMERTVNSTGDGEYIVDYTACWPDRSCHKGKFAFLVNSSQLGTFTDLSGQTEVRMNMKDITFDKPRIIISQGTKVTWTNRDPVDHFVNSDPHPSHNFIANFSSFNLKSSESYSHTFNEAGEFHYHCSAHVPDGMMAAVIVRTAAPKAAAAPSYHTVEADDYGFYANGSRTGSLSVAKGSNTTITFMTRSQGVYYGGLDYRSAKFNSPKTAPGESWTSPSFIADATFTVTSYWPASNVRKADLEIIAA